MPPRRKTVPIGTLAGLDVLLNTTADAPGGTPKAHYIGLAMGEWAITPCSAPSPPPPGIALVPSHPPSRLHRGLLHSRAFPDLVLDVSALLAMNAPKVLTVLQRALASPAHKAFVESLRSRADIEIRPGSLTEKK